MTTDHPSLAAILPHPRTADVAFVGISAGKLRAAAELVRGLQHREDSILEAFEEGMELLLADDWLMGQHRSGLLRSKTTEAIDLLRAMYLLSKSDQRHWL